MVIPLVETASCKNIVLGFDHKKFSILYNGGYHPRSGVAMIDMFGFETSIIKCRRYQTVGGKISLLITGP